MSGERRIHDVLRRLRMLSEAKAQALEAPLSHGKPGAKAPPGTGLSLKDLSLHEFYRREFAGASTAKARSLLLYSAERDYQEHRYGLGENRTALLALKPNEERYAAFIITHYEGTDANEVAIKEGVKPGWVMKVRELSKREPCSGERRIEWKQLAEGDRWALIERYAAENGSTIRSVARRLGVAKSVVHFYWPKEGE